MDGSVFTKNSLDRIRTTIDIAVTFNDQLANGEVQSGSEAESNVNDKARDNIDDVEGQSKFISDNVVNLSERIFTKSEISVLSKGLKFCPTPRDLDNISIRNDIKEFGRKLKCRAYIHLAGGGSGQQSSRLGAFRKSSWTPDVVDPSVDFYLTALVNRICAISGRGKNYSNLTKEEREALKKLKGYRDIVIKKVDKGSAVVV